MVLKNKFILLFQGRTGSSYLKESLNSHPDIIMQGEVWAGMKYIPKNKRKQNAKKQLEWAQKFFGKTYNKKIKAIGFKTKFIDVLDPKEFARFLEQNNIKIIYMTRQNIVKLTISEINARRLYNKIKVWNLSSEKYHLQAFNLNLNRFKKRLKEKEQMETKLKIYIKTLNLPILKIYYEDLLMDEFEILRKINKFLEVPFRKTKGNSIKNTSDNLREVLLNFDEIQSHYIGTKYESMFDEVLSRKRAKLPFYRRFYERLKRVLSKKIFLG
ncbi:sulfotransferase domain-containing protein [Candidatus Woesearchaeota archaeon]|nr:sulfotransferase domain-containing protein [Candidatus Woesearchaeota archaeon]